MFGWLLVLHVLAAVAVIGSSFLLPIIRRSAKTIAQLRFIFDITAKVAWFFKVGGAVLVLTGIWFMVNAQMGFSQMWLNLSILLSLMLVVTISVLMEPRIKRIARIVSESQGHELTADVVLAMRKLAPLEITAQLLALAITVLMVVKPVS